MANKRQLKKAICRACGEIASECIFASELLVNEADIENWDKIIVDVALLQAEAVNRVSESFKQLPKDFATVKEYKKARNAHAKQVVKGINDMMTETLKGVAAKMNALMPKKA
ncbi:MAG: hypothetical protein MJZ74_01625 [Muribaculaceae bacterium]|nr:hypothetical protein [Muribaculaceae bacterium]